MDWRGYPNVGDAAPRRERRAIVVADLAESVRLIHGREQETIERWLAFVGDVQHRVLPASAGRMVKSLGDGVMLTFDSARAGLEAALELHESIRRVNDGVDPEWLMLLRVAVHVADVVADDIDVYGAGVNIAARLAGLAQPGETLLSEAARDEVVDGLHAEIEDMGLRYVKHLDRPLRAFRARHAKEKSSGGTTPGGLCLPPARDLRPALAVVPFVCMPASAVHDALGHAMADDIIAAMARHPSLRVLSRASTAPLRDRAITPVRMHRLLGASFLLSGRYYVLGERARLTVELCSLPGAEVVWSGSAMASIDSIFAGEDELVPHVVANVAQHIHMHELARVRSLPLESLASYSLYLGASGLLNSLEPSAFGMARRALDHLVERHPRQAAPYAMLARWHVFRSVQGWSDDEDAESRAALQQASRALDIDPKQAMALASAGLVRMNYHDDAEDARRLYMAATEADPLEAHAWAWRTAVHSFCGEHDEARACAARALAVSPLDPCRYLFEAWAAMADLGAGCCEDAVAHAQASVRLNALHAPSLRILVAALWLSGLHEEARAAVPRLKAVRPNARAGGMRAHISGSQPVWGGAFDDALRAAGLPP
ncbi:adenylate/guanylate cyclase domain-containing protein [Methylibium rhizosphaerae]|uniref:adenylate/guanylate cyclase domain-containing protein n=1 Tax=Methylibium rhizosphaerae TaxID=2570323 RepID=UPI0015E2905C|nr:adenylate/guanylate cyclase domain-containing protein [Methylibium rhizosphaerae]